MPINPKGLIPFVMLVLAALTCIPPQDCERVSRTLAGDVRNTDGEPIEGARVSVESTDSGYYSNESPPFEQMLTTDRDGQFSTGAFDIFLCEGIRIEVSADGYLSSTFSYPGWAGTAVYTPNLMDLIITLEKAD